MSCKRTDLSPVFAERYPKYYKWQGNAEDLILYLVFDSFDFESMLEFGSGS
jgi:hypothetical protein